MEKQIKKQSGQATGDYPCIRYAEILLIYAEAHTHTAGFDSQTQAALNELRDRCGMPDVPTSLSKEEGLELIANDVVLSWRQKGSAVTICIVTVMNIGINISTM